MTNVRLHIICLIITPLVCCGASVAQTGVHAADTTPALRLVNLNPRLYKSSDSLWVYSGICKTLNIRLLTGREASRFIRGELIQPPFLKINGNIQYDFTYRSLVDTPFAQNNFRQHTVQTSLNVVVKDKYPFRVTILSRHSNSPYFDDMTDVNVQFSQGMYLQQLKNRLNRRILEQAGHETIMALQRLYDRKKTEVLGLQNWLNHPARVQEIIQYREAQAGRRGSLPGVPGNSNDVQLPGAGNTPATNPQGGFIPAGQRLRNPAGSSATTPAQPQNIAGGATNISEPSVFTQKKEALQKALEDLKNYEDRLALLGKSLRDSIARLQQQLAGITSTAGLNNFVKQHRLDAKSLPAGFKTLAAIQQIGLGRTWVDYSELTVKNISLTGINVEVNPNKLYMAFAAGRVNYRFRDFVVSNRNQPVQSLYLVRAGLGRKEGNNLILTWYDGRRNLLQNFGSSAAALRPERVIGVSLQSRLQLDANRFIILETAKSSFHNTGTVSQGADGLLQKVGNFRDRSNEAYSISVSGYWPGINTRISGYYRRMGEHFQSFNLQPVNVVQEAYQLKAQRSFWKRRLTVEGGLRKNDFSNPLIYPGVSSKTVFKSLQATLRVPRYPFISVGYFPSSQLTALDNNIIAENQYQTLSIITGHTWRTKGAGMSTNAVYLKFFNNSSDSGFIYFNASSFTVNHTIFLKNFQLQSGLTVIRQREISMNTLEQTLNWQAGRWLTLSGGLKYNRLNGTQTLWGGTGGLGLQLKKLGTIQAMYDRSYLPGTGRNLLPVDMGRVTFYRTF